MKTFGRTIPLLLLAVILASCNSFPSTPTISDADILETAISTVSTAFAGTQAAISMATPVSPSVRIVYYYFVPPAAPLPDGSVVIMPEAYILAPTFADAIYSSDTAADLRTALETVFQDSRNGWISSGLEVTAVTFGNGHADIVLQGEYYGVGDVTLIAASRQVLLTIFANPSVQTATVTLNGHTIGNLGISLSSGAKPDDYVYTRAEIESYMKNANISP